MKSRLDELSPLLSPRELGQVLNVRPGTIFSWISRGIDLPPCILIAGSRRWDPGVVAEWIRAKEKEQRRKNFTDEPDRSSLWSGDGQSST
jgi:predicted DNA-binding transcriptional regulator AlpA